MPNLSFVRRAAAVAVLGFYVWFFGTYANYAPPVLSKALWAIAALYGVGVIGLVLGWFWGRWYARGLGYWGKRFAAFNEADEVWAVVFCMAALGVVGMLFISAIRSRVLRWHASERAR